jgi:hypothetical protein
MNCTGTFLVMLLLLLMLLYCVVDMICQPPLIYSHLVTIQYNIFCLYI